MSQQNKPQATGNCPPTQIVDYWTFNHAAVGAIYGALGISRIGTIALKAGFETIENPMKEVAPWLFPSPCPDDFKAQILDVGFGVLGWEVYHWIRRSTSKETANTAVALSATAAVLIYLATFKR